MRVGLFVNVPADSLPVLPVDVLAGAGLWAVFVRCYEDEVRWRAPVIAEFVHSAADAGLRVFIVPAGYGGVLAAAQHPSSLFLQVHPDTRQVDNRGRPVPYACPNNPRYLEWVTSAVRTLAWLLDADGFAWEEPGFFFGRGLWACRCKWCSELYYARGKGPIPAELDESVASFRQQSVAQFVSALATAVKSVDSALASLVMPTPAPQTGAIPTGNENWRLLAATEGVDGLVLTWPPAVVPRASMSGATGLLTGARRWLDPSTTVLMRIICPPDLRDVELTLRQLRELKLVAAIVEYPGQMFRERQPTVAAKRLLGMLERVAE